MYRIKTEIPDLRERFGDLPRKSQAQFRIESSYLRQAGVGA
jgi:hypothetical protein